MAPVLVLTQTCNQDEGDGLPSPFLSLSTSSLDPLSPNTSFHDRLPGAKHSRRPFHWSRPKAYTRHQLASSTDPIDIASVRPHHRALYAANLARHRVPRDPETSWWDTHHSPRKNGSYFGDRRHSEDVELARCREVRLPGQPRVPSLERQDAFCEGRRGVSLKKAASTYPEGERGRKRGLEVDDEELYRMGLLYDDEHERGEAFGLDMIERGPVVVRMVPARGRRGRKGRRVTFDNTSPAEKEEQDAEWEEEKWRLDLALSFAQLGDDEALAALLMAPDAEERAAVRPGRVTRRNEGLKVVYELEEDSCWTQQPHLEEDDWAFLDGSLNTNHDDDQSSATATNPDTDAWIMLGGDGS